MFLSFRLLLLSSVLHTVIKFPTLTITASITTTWHYGFIHGWQMLSPYVILPNFPFKGNVMFGGKPTHTLVKTFSVVFTSRKCKHPFNFLALIANQKFSRELKDVLHISMLVGSLLLLPAKLLPVKKFCNILLSSAYSSVQNILDREQLARWIPKEDSGLRSGSQGCYFLFISRIFILLSLF